MDFVLGVIVGVVFSPLLIKLAKIGWTKLEKYIERLRKK